MIGNLFNLGACYVTNVSLTYSDSFNELGFPLALKASVQVTCADQVLCQDKGDFVVNIPPQNAKGLSNFLEKAQITKNNVKENVSKLIKVTGSFYKGKD